MVIKSLPGGDVLRLKDVARIEMGAENYAMLSSTNGHPGANGNISVGVSTVGGMLFGTIGLLFVVPTLFIVFQTIQEHFKRNGGR